MELIDTSEVTEFSLLEGTKDAFAFKWPTGRFPIGEFMPQVDGVLLEKMLPMFDSQPSTRGFVFLVHGIRLGWCFTALEAERARDDLAKAHAKIDALTRRLNDLELRVNEVIR